MFKNLKNKVMAKKAFKGNSFRIGDDDSAKEKKEQEEKETVIQLPLGPEVEEIPDEDMPRPGNRYIVVSKSPGNKAFVLKDTTSDEDFKLTAQDVKNSSRGEPRTFQSVRKELKPSPLIVRIRFIINYKGETYTIEAKFASKEYLSSIYDFLESEVFEKYEKYQILTMPMKAPFPRDDVTLVSRKFKGAFQLMVNITGDATFKL